LLAILVTVNPAIEVVGVLTVAVQSIAPVQVGSPPPVAVTVLIAGFATPATIVTGTLIEILPIATPAAIEHPASDVPPTVNAGVHVKVPPVIVGNALNDMFVGNVSVNKMGASVAASLTAMLIV
jgi:hypothetical protein